LALFDHGPGRNPGPGYRSLVPQLDKGFAASWLDLGEDGLLGCYGIFGNTGNLV